jgi:prepilin-type N-terminal cleavage/methylation domain-containing protein
MKKLNKKGFTLIELLVVVAIIAILAGIVLVSLNSARERSEKASLQSTMASVMPVLSMCENDNETLNAVPADPAATPTYVCGDGTEITEQWPALPDNLSEYNYSLSTDETQLLGYGPDSATEAIITCSIATGSCQ